MSCHLYWIYVWDPRTNFTTLTLGYVGESNDPLARFYEHLDEQPWSDTIPDTNPDEALASGILVVSDEVYPDKLAAWLAEEAAVLRDRPLYNYEYNLSNPDRIPVYAARAARAERDAANGIPLKQSWAARFEQRRRGRDAAVPAWKRLVLSPAARRRAGWSALWLVPTLLGWWMLTRYLPVVSTWRLGGVAGALVAILLLWVTRPRRGRNRRRRQAANLAIRIVLTCVVVWLLLAPTFAAVPR